MMIPQEWWEYVMPPERRWFGLFVLGVLGIHLAALALVRVEVAEGGLHPPRARQVTLISPRLDSPLLGGRDWAVWLDWKDPSAIALPWSPLPSPPLPPLESGKEVGSALPPLTAQAPLPGAGLGQAIEQRAAQSVQTGTRAPMPIPVESPPRLSGTRYRADWSRAERALLTPPQLPRPRTDMALQHTVLTVLVNRMGLVESVLVVESSTDPAVDLAAIQSIRTWRFAADPTAPDPEAVRITVFWDLQAKALPEAP